jgi:TPR repeat protein
MTRSNKAIRIAVVFLAVAIALGAALFTRRWMFDTAGLALKEGDYVRARERLEPLALLGDSLAQQFMGDFYAYGWGVPKDDETAISWYRRAGHAGGAITDAAAESMYFVGKRYLGGQGVSRDDAEARKWFERAKQGGYAAAQQELQALP